MKTIILILAMMMGSLLSIAQCPDSITCDNDSIYFHYSTSTPPITDTIRAVVGGSTIHLTVFNGGPSVISTDKNGISCTDTITSFTFWVNGVPSVGSGCTTAYVLPVELISFYTQGDNIHWTTASEINNSHFEVQYSIDGITWEVVGLVTGNGTTNSLTDYIFYHTTNQSSYYRLKQVDYDGASEYSDIIRRSIRERELVQEIVFRLDGAYTTKDDPRAIIYRKYSNGEEVRTQIIH